VKKCSDNHLPSGSDNDLTLASKLGFRNGCLCRECCVTHNIYLANVRQNPSFHPTMFVDSVDWASRSAVLRRLGVRPIIYAAGTSPNISGYSDLMFPPSLPPGPWNGSDYDLTDKWYVGCPGWDYIKSTPASLTGYTVSVNAPTTAKAAAISKGYADCKRCNFRNMYIGVEHLHDDGTYTCRSCR
jgi:hypothetical protein